MTLLFSKPSSFFYCTQLSNKWFIENDEDYFMDLDPFVFLRVSFKEKQEINLYIQHVYAIRALRDEQFENTFSRTQKSKIYIIRCALCHASCHHSDLNKMVRD